MSKTIRIRQCNADKFSKFRTTQIQEGIKATIGIQPNGASQIQSFEFDHTFYPLPKAKEWVKTWKDSLKENFGILPFNGPIKEAMLQISGTSALSPEMNNDKAPTVPDDIKEIYPDCFHSNGRVNREKCLIHLNEVKAFEKYLSKPDFKKLNRLLFDLLKESTKEILADNGFNLQESETSFTADDFDVVLKEGVRDSSVRRAKVVLIKSGESKNGNIYTGKALMNAVPLFEGIPIYPNHSDSERKVEEKVGFYSNPEYVGDENSGEIQAVANIFESEQKMWDLVKEQANHPNAKLCGFSINAFGKGRELKEDPRGKTKRVVESIVLVDSTDIVNNPSAGGRVLELLESVKNTYNTQNSSSGEESMDLSILKEKHSDLVKQIEDSAKALILKEEEAKAEKMVKCPHCEKEYAMKESVEHYDSHIKELNVKLSESVKLTESLTKDVTINKLKEAVTAKLQTHKTLPELVKVRLVEKLLDLGEEKREGEKPSNWDSVITEELNYVNQIRGTKGDLVLGSEKTEEKTETAEVKLTENEKRAIAKSISKVL